MGPEQLLALHHLRHAELIVEVEVRARAFRAAREARAERIRALRRAADGAGAAVRRSLTGRSLTHDRTTVQDCVACAAA